MKLFVLLTVLAFASKNGNDPERAEANSRGNSSGENPILVKIEEEEHAKKEGKTSKYIGVYYHEKTRKWVSQRWSKRELKHCTNGGYKDEETAAHASDTLVRKLMENDKVGHKLNFPGDKTEVHRPPKESTGFSKYFGVSYNEISKRWVAQRWSKKEYRYFSNGANYRNEEKTAHASDTLARKLMENGEKGHKLNFPDDSTEVYPEEKTTSSRYVGLCYVEKRKRWYVQRWSKIEKKIFSNGAYKDEETAAHASDTLARELMQNGEEVHKLNFPDEKTQVYSEKATGPEKTTTDSKYTGIYYNKKRKRWSAERWSKIEKKLISNGYYRNQEMAARASDSLARTLMAKGEGNHKLNFPDSSTDFQKQNLPPEEQKNKRKRSFDSEYPQADGNYLEKSKSKDVHLKFE